MLAKFSTTELEGLLTKFPYFQQAHVLLAKKYQQEGNPKFDEQLQLAVLYSQDREFLYSLFQETERQDVPEVAQKVMQSVYQQQPEQEPETDESVLQMTEPVEQIRETVKEEEVQEQPAVVENIQPEVVIEQAPVLNPVIEQEEQTETFNLSESHTFMEWVNAFLQAKPMEEKQTAVPAAPDVEEQDKELEQQYVANLPLQELVEEETHYSKGLEAFIAEQKQKHKASDLKVTHAEETEIPPMLITETMAKVYETQKKYAKAIKAYEILSLKYPEKNDFFAARISELKNLI